VNTAEISFVVIVGVMVAFYFIFIRPAREEQKLQEGAIRDLRAGDDVITTAGFLARVKEINTPEEGPVELVLDFGNGIEMRALTTSVYRRVSGAPEPVETLEEAKETS
jgi:preprotein translocase subunit YajC